MRERIAISMVQRVSPGIAYLHYFLLLSGKDWPIGSDHAHGK
jgi:hypothetical protein